MQHSKRIAAVGTAAACVLAGGAIGISQSVAAGNKTAAKSATSSTAPSRANGRHAGPGGSGGPGGPSGGLGGGPGMGGGVVHSVSEQLDKAGTAYIAVTTDSGTVTAVDATAGTITLTEGTSKVTYATPTLTIPSGATVTLDGKSSALSDIVKGDHVTVSSSSDGTKVFATDSSFRGGPAGGQGGGPAGGQGNWA